jgi:hypothetical protein
MDKTTRFLQLKNVHSQDVMDVFEEIVRNGDRILLKCDGPRSNNRFTVVVSVHESGMVSFRNDAPNLIEALRIVLSQYVSHKLA